MSKEISSLQNPLIKQIVLLSEKSRERRRSGLFVIEGSREIMLAIEGGYAIKTLLYCEEILDQSINDFTTSNTELIKISTEVYQKIAYRNTTEGIVAIAEAKELTLENLNIKGKAPLILVAEAPEKPGNIGALLRTADAAKLDAVIIANAKTDLYNPNIIRSSVGCLFTIPIATATTNEIIDFLKEKKIPIYCAALQASKRYDSINYNDGAAIVVGTEATGLSEEWLVSSSQNIVIPMQGVIDSMNVSVAAGIIIFEAKRQRDFYK